MNQLFFSIGRRGAQDPHINFLARGLMNSLEQKEEEFIAVVTTLFCELLIHGVIHCSGEATPEGSGTNTLTLITFPEKLNNLCEGGSDSLKLRPPLRGLPLEESVVLALFHDPDKFREMPQILHYGIAVTRKTHIHKTTETFGGI